MTPAPSTEELVKRWQDVRRADRGFPEGHPDYLRELEVRGDRMATALAEQATTIAKLEREIEIRKHNAERHRVCSGHSGKQPTDGECIMCFAERHERGRNQHEAKIEAAEQAREIEGLTETLEDEQAAHTETLRLWKSTEAEVERLTGEVARMDRSITINNQLNAITVAERDEELKVAEAERDTARAALVPPLWLVWSNEHGAWWRGNKAGYTTHIGGAGRYTLADAVSCCGNRDPRKDGGPDEVVCPSPELIALIQTALPPTPGDVKKETDHA